MRRSIFLNKVGSFRYCREGRLTFFPIPQLDVNEKGAKRERERGKGHHLSLQKSPIRSTVVEVGGGPSLSHCATLLSFLLHSDGTTNILNTAQDYCTVHGQTTPHSFAFSQKERKTGSNFLTVLSGTKFYTSKSIF